MAYRYTLTHEHEYGASVYNFTSPQPIDMLGEDGEKVLAEILGIDYEPEKGESLSLIDATGIDHALTMEEYQRIDNAGN
jgi:hypothetical protein